MKKTFIALGLMSATLTVQAVTFQKWNNFLEWTTPAIFSSDTLLAGSKPTVVVPATPMLSKPLEAPAAPLQAREAVWTALPYFDTPSPLSSPRYDLYSDGVLCGPLQEGAQFLVYDNAVAFKDGPVWSFPMGVAPQQRTTLAATLSALPQSDGRHLLTIRSRSKQ